ncbi:CPBP family intramembrane glutamic endopeptidase [candidate division KSB1 bacterium]
MSVSKSFTSNNPILFGILITFMALVFYIITAGIAASVSQDSAGYNYAEAIGRTAASFLFLIMLWRFGWFRSSGAGAAGNMTVWIITLVIIIYEFIINQYALFGNVVFSMPENPLSLPVGLNALASGPIEEIPFRAIVLYAFIRIWGDTRQGIFRSVVYSSLLFSTGHFIHLLLGVPFSTVGMKVIVTFLSGIYYAALVLRWRTIWTVALLHGVINAVMSIRAVNVEGFSESASALGIVTLFQIPLVLFGIYIIAKLPLRKVVSEVD